MKQFFLVSGHLLEKPQYIYQLYALFPFPGAHQQSVLVILLTQKSPPPRAKRTATRKATPASKKGRKKPKLEVEKEDQEEEDGKSDKEEEDLKVKCVSSDWHLMLSLSLFRPPRNSNQTAHATFLFS